MTGLGRYVGFIPSRTHLRPNDTELQDVKCRVLIIPWVEAYPAWKVVFDRAADIRKHAGEIRYQLLRHDRDANSIVHFSEWSSLD